MKRTQGVTGGTVEELEIKRKELQLKKKRIELEREAESKGIPLGPDFQPVPDAKVRDLTVPPSNGRSKKSAATATAATAHHAGIACALGTLVRSSGSVCGDAMAPDRCVRCASYERWPKWFTGGLISRMPPSVYRPLGAYLNAGRRLSHLGRGLVYPWLVEQAVRAKRKVLDLSEIIVAPSAAFRDLLIRNGRDP